MLQFSHWKLLALSELSVWKLFSVEQSRYSSPFVIPRMAWHRSNNIPKSPEIGRRPANGGFPLLDGHFYARPAAVSNKRGPAKTTFGARYDLFRYVFAYCKCDWGAEGRQMSRGQLGLHHRQLAPPRSTRTLLSPFVRRDIKPIIYCRLVCSQGFSWITAIPFDNTPGF